VNSVDWTRVNGTQVPYRWSEKGDWRTIIA